MGYEVVRVAFRGGRTAVLQVMVERTDRAEMTVEDCAGVSRAVSALLDVEDPIGGAYTLEVSSPGIDRPLTRQADFARFAGFEAQIELSVPMDGRRRFRGRLQGLDADGGVRLEMDGTTVVVPYGDIGTAKLVLTDELIAAGDRLRHTEIPKRME